MPTGSSAPPAAATAPVRRDAWLPEIAAFVAAVIGHLPALGAWWNLDDWGQLARAAGLEQAPGGWPARWLSQHAYWDLTWPLFGLDSDAHAVLRLILHGLAAVLVVRIAWRAGLGSLSRSLAGLIFAASPLAFTPLYWASGIQELLAAVFALAAVERWLAAPQRGRRQLVWATGFTVLSLLSKESGIGLPLFFLACAWSGVGVRQEDKAFAWAMIMFQLLAAVAAGVLVLDHFATGAGEPYATGGLAVVLLNLGAFGWWLISPGPILAARISVMMAGAGGLLFVVWAAWGILQLRRGSPVIWLTWVAALLVLAPALPLRSQVVPYLAYLAVAPLGLLLGTLAHQGRAGKLAHLGRLPLFGFFSLAAIAWGFFGMETRLGNRTELGLVADPVARATSLSWQASRTLQELRAHPGLTAAGREPIGHLTLLQPLVDPNAFELATNLGERWTQPSDMYRALSGTVGPQLVLGPDVRTHWANGLTTASSKSIVLCETATGFRLWGRLENALLYAGLTDVGLGHFARARDHFRRAAELGGKQIVFLYDEGQMVIPLQLVVSRKQAFIDWTVGLLDQGATALEVGGLQDMFFNLLSSSTGQSQEELTAGSRLITRPDRPDTQP